MEATINDLKFDPKNPRKISDYDYAVLKKDLDKFGDLSGIILNLTTGELIGGHMRVRAFQEQQGKVQITQTLPEETKRGTVRLGYVIVDGEPHTYREVRWSPEIQRVANIAANRAGGEWDRDLLAEALFDISGFDDSSELLLLTALHEDEISDLLDSVSATQNDKSQNDECHISVKLSDDQLEIVNQVLMHVLAHNEFDLNINPDRNGNALYYICKQYVDSQILTPMV